MKRISLAATLTFACVITGLSAAQPIGGAAIEVTYGVRKLDV